MPDSTEAKLNDALLRSLVTREGVTHRAIDAGWTPPDPHEDIARELGEYLGACGWADASAEDGYADLLAAVRRMDLRRGDR